jgi:type IX secretion system PorP/SprF family membrane protein
MDFKSIRQVIYKFWLIFLLVFIFSPANGQQTPLNPISYWVFTPHIYNPAMVGSKDFLSVGINAAFQGAANTELFSGNTRITKTSSGYFSSPDITEFRNIGVGAAIFNDFDGASKNTGLNLAGSYQIPLNTRKLSYLSFGLAAKAEFNTITSDVNKSVKKNSYPNADIGIYYYGPNFFSGISAVNLLGSPWKPDSLGLFRVPVSREYFLTAGYKILLSKSLNIVLEPSVMILATDSTFSKTGKNIYPIIKLYMEDFCLGSSFHSGGKTSFFIQYRYPKFFIGAYYELANKTAYYKNKPTVQFTMGLNIQSDRSRFSHHSHW